MEQKISKSSFYIKKWHSITGVIPLGAFMILHIYTQSYITMGQGAYSMKMAESIFSPWILPFEIIFLYIPLFFHMIIGIKLSIESKYNFKYRYLDNWRFFLQRLSGLGLGAFIIAHVILTKGHSWFAKDGWVDGVPIEGWFTHMQNAMQNNLTFIVYFLGILAAAGHFGNGFWTFFNSMGWSRGERAQNKLKIFSIFLIVILAAAGLYPIFYLRFS